MNKKRKNQGLPEEEPLTTKLHIGGVIDREVYAEFKKLYEKECKDAEANDRTRPSVSEILEMIIRKGLKAYYQEKP